MTIHEQKQEMEQRGRINIAGPVIGEREEKAVKSVLSSGQLAQGADVRQFEAEFADRCSTDHGIATSNGTTALHTALEALDIGAGDTVITTPFTFVATANAIRFVDAEPLFVDIDPETLNIDPAAVEAAIRERDGDVDGVIAVHLYGLAAELDVLSDICDRFDIPLIEDAAQAHGATYRSQPVGSVGDVGCFSFYPTKNMTTGEGGMVVTDRDDVADAASRFIDHGRAEGYEHTDLGHNFRMTNIAAAIGRVQLDRLDGLLEQRRTNAQRLRDGLENQPLALPPDPDHRRHVYNQFTVRTSMRDPLQTMLDRVGIDTGIYYPTPLHQQPAFEGQDEDLRHSERAAKQVLSLPVHPGLSKTDIDTVISAISTFDFKR